MPTRGISWTSETQRPLAKTQMRSGRMGLKTQTSGCFATVLLIIDVRGLPWKRTTKYCHALSIVLSNAETNPSEPLLRTLLEATTSVRYMVEDDFERRSAVYQVTQMRARLEDSERFDSDTDAGEELPGVPIDNPAHVGDRE